MENQLKFNDFSFIFEFLFECQKTGVLNSQEREKVKADFIAQNTDIIEVFRESMKENHQNLPQRLKTYLFAKTLHKNLTQPEELPITHSRTISTGHQLKKPLLPSRLFSENDNSKILRKAQRFSTQLVGITENNPFKKNKTIDVFNKKKLSSHQESNIEVGQRLFSLKSRKSGKIEPKAGFDKSAFINTDHFPLTDLHSHNSKENLYLLDELKSIYKEFREDVKKKNLYSLITFENMRPNRIYDSVKDFIEFYLRLQNFAFLSYSETEENAEIFNFQANEFKKIIISKELLNSLKAAKSFTDLKAERPLFVELFEKFGLGQEKVTKSAYLMPILHENKRIAVIFLPRDETVFSFFYRHRNEEIIQEMLKNYSKILVDLMVSSRVAVFSLDQEISEKIYDFSKKFISYLPINFLLKIRSLMSKRLFLKWEIGFVKGLRDLKPNFCPFMLSNSDLFLYFDKESKDFDQIVKKLSLSIKLTQIEEYFRKLRAFLNDLLDDLTMYKQLLKEKSIIMDFDKLGFLIFLNKNLSSFSEINLNYRSSSEIHNIHYEEVFAKKPGIIRVLQLQTNEIKASNWYVTRPSRRVSAEIPIGVDFILKKKANMKFNGFFLIYDEEFEFKIHEEENEAEALNSSEEEDDIEIDAITDRRHQSVMFKSKDDNRSNFKLQEILKKRFKSFSRVKKYKALEKKIKEIRILNPEIQDYYVQEYFPDVGLTTQAEKSEVKTEGKEESASPMLFQQRSIHAFEGINEVSEWDTNYQDFMFNVLNLKEIRDQFQLTVKTVLGNENRIKFMISLSKFSEFWQKLREKYDKRGNFFHNFEHGLNVMHGCYMFITKTSVREYLSDIERFALVFSGLCHDVSHRGYTNNFEIHSYTKLAIRYHDKSVLEQHHAATTFRLMKQEKCDFLSRMEKQQFQLFRKLVVTSILATDMKEHFEYQNKFEAFCNEIKDKKHEFEQSEAHRILLSNVVLHCCDFSGNVKPFPIARVWSERINQEFSKQYTRESELKIPQTPYMKNLDTIEVMSKAESNFLKVIVRPLWLVMNNFLGDELSEQIKILNENIIEWEKISNENPGIEKKRTVIMVNKDPVPEESKEEVKTGELKMMELKLGGENEKLGILNVSRRESQHLAPTSGEAPPKKIKSFKKVDFSNLNI